MELLTEYAALAVPLILYGWPLLRGLKNPRRYEQERFRRQTARGPIRHATLGAATGATTGLALLLGWQNAALRWLWLVLGILMLAMSLMAALAAAFGQLAPRAVPQRSGELSDRALQVLVRRRRISHPIVMVLLLLWIYSWRHLFLGAQ